MLDTAARIALSPFLIGQALRIRRIAQSLPEAAGPRSGRIGDGPLLRVGIFGDSSAAGVGVAHQSQALAGQLMGVLSHHYEVHWHLDAMTGATTRSTLSRLKDADTRPLDIAIVALGVNDVTRLIPAAVWVRQQHALLTRLQAVYQPRHFYISGMPPLEHFPLLPQPLRWTLGRHASKLEQHRIAYLNGRRDCTHVPFDLNLDPELVAGDGFHPSAKLYALWGNEMASRIISDWPTLKS